MDVDGVGHAHLRDDHVAEVHPAFEGQDFEEGQHGAPDVVKVESSRVHPDPGGKQAWTVASLA